jgi:hypothetical protein
MDGSDRTAGLFEIEEQCRVALVRSLWLTTPPEDDGNCGDQAAIASLAREPIAYQRLLTDAVGPRRLRQVGLFERRSIASDLD